MEYRPFGKTGMHVSAIGFGCWEIGGGYGSIEETQFIHAVQRSLDLGVNCFDTAEAYGFGASEKSLAKALGARRKDAVVVTKFGIGYKEAPNFRDSGRARAMASIEKSLQNLGTDYVDVYMVHWPDVNTPLDETMRALDDIVKQGKARAVGISNFRLAQIKTSMNTRRVDVAQYCWNIFDQRMQKEIFPYCKEQNIGVMAYGSLAYGLLTGAFNENTDFGGDDWRARRGRMGAINLFQHLFGPEYFPKNLKVVEDLKGLAAKYGKTLPQFALRWTLTNPVISTALVGCRNVNEVNDNMGALSWSISEADMKAIDESFARHDVDPTPNVWLERD